MNIINTPLSKEDVISSADTKGELIVIVSVTLPDIIARDEANLKTFLAKKVTTARNFGVDAYKVAGIIGNHILIQVSGNVNAIPDSFNQLHLFELETLFRRSGRHDELLPVKWRDGLFSILNEAMLEGSSCLGKSEDQRTSKQVKFIEKYCTESNIDYDIQTIDGEIHLVFDGRNPLTTFHVDSFLSKFEHYVDTEFALGDQKYVVKSLTSMNKLPAVVLQPIGGGQIVLYTLDEFLKQLRLNDTDGGDTI